MCIEDLKIAAKMRSIVMPRDANDVYWVAPADPTRHSVVILSQQNSIDVFAQNGSVLQYIFRLARYTADPMFGGVYYNETAVLLTSEIGDILTGPLFIANGSNDPVFAPYWTKPDVDIARQLETMLR